MASICFGSHISKITVVNTLILLTSGATITVAHLAIIEIKSNKLWSIDCNCSFSRCIYSIQFYEYRHAPFLYLMVFMALFLYFNWLSRYSCYYGTIFIIVQSARVVREHLRSEVTLDLRLRMVLAFRGCRMASLVYNRVRLWRKCYLNFKNFSFINKCF